MRKVGDLSRNLFLGEDMQVADLQDFDIKRAVISLYVMTYGGTAKLNDKHKLTFSLRPYIKNEEMFLSVEGWATDINGGIHHKIILPKNKYNYKQIFYTKSISKIEYPLKITDLWNFDITESVMRLLADWYCLSWNDLREIAFTLKSPYGDANTEPYIVLSACPLCDGPISSIDISIVGR
jgi:hypothetical protein